MPSVRGFPGATVDIDDNTAGLYVDCDILIPAALEKQVRVVSWCWPAPPGSATCE